VRAVRKIGAKRNITDGDEWLRDKGAQL